MKIFASNKIWKKLIIAFFLVVFVSWINPNTARAESNSGIGGTLMKPVSNLLITACDAVVNVTHRVLIKQNQTLINIDKSDGKFLIFATIVATALIAVAIVVATGGLGAGLIGTLLSAAIKVGIGTLVVGSIGAAAYGGAIIYDLAGFQDDNIAIPMYAMSPEELFRNEVALFNVNFFTPSDKTTKYDNLISRTQSKEADWAVSSECKSNGKLTKEQKSTLNEKLKEHDSKLTIGKIRKYALVSDDNITDNTGASSNVKTYQNRKNKNTIDVYKVSYVGSNIWVSHFTITEERDSGEIPAYSSQLSEMVGHWYVIILTIAVAGMLSVLVYIGIRMMISSTASDKAKYKQFFGDWVIALIIMFMMHYGMNFANAFADDLTELFGTMSNRLYFVYLEDDSDGTIKEALAQAGFEIKEASDEDRTGDSDVTVYEKKYKETDENGNEITKTRYEMKTNMMGYIRYEAQRNSNDSEVFLGYTILFIIMTIYLFVFVIQYLKRVVYMAFLTIIAPLVAMTYPIDKVNDGQAQGFNFWFKEYAFNLLLQPMHLLLYSILVGSAISLATENMIYAIVAMGFMVPGEKLLRQMFNFNKAQTPGIFGGVAGAALTMKGLQWFSKLGKGGSSDSSNKDKGGSTGGDSSSSGSSKIKTSKLADQLGDGNGSSGGIASGLGTGADSVGAGSGSRRTGTGSIGAAIGSGRTGTGSGGVGGMNNRSKKRKILNKINPFSDDNINRRNANKRVLSMYGSELGKNFKRSLKNAKPVSKLSKLATGAIGAATLGTVGFAAGVASGDLGKTAQYTGAAAGIGAKVGSSGALQFDGEGYKNDLLEQPEYKEKKKQKQIRDLIDDERNVQKTMTELGIGDRSEAVNTMKHFIPQYIDNGFGADEFDKMLQIEKVTNSYAREKIENERNNREERRRQEENRNNSSGDDSAFIRQREENTPTRDEINGMTEAERTRNAAQRDARAESEVNENIHDLTPQEEREITDRTRREMMMGYTISEDEGLSKVEMNKRGDFKQRHQRDNGWTDRQTDYFMDLGDTYSFYRNQLKK